MKLNTYSYNNAAGIVKHSCGIIFILFTFFYLFFLQGEILSKAQYIFSDGKTSYSIFWGALIITLILRLIQLPAQKFMKVPVRLHAISYIPSFLLLTIICYVSGAAINDCGKGWLWFFILLFIIAISLIQKFSLYLESLCGSNMLRSNHLSTVLWPNFLIFILSILLCGTCNPLSEVDFYEQKVERLVDNDNNKAALEVGKNSINSNLRLTNLRMFALSKLDLLPECLFDYPQYYGSQGLLSVPDTNNRLFRIDARDISMYLGVLCDSSIHSTDEYFKAVKFRQQLVSDSLMGIELMRSDNPDSLKKEIVLKYDILKREKSRIEDYILCGLLLDRNIDAFKEMLDKAYAFEVSKDSVVSVENLPCAYREALVMIYPEIGDMAMIKLYSKFLDLKESVKDSTASSNITRKTKISNSTTKTFGNSFWWYYYNPKITKRNYLQ